MPNTTISQREFVSQLAASEGSLNINELPPALQKKLQDAGVDPAALKRIAGSDAQISGEREMTALFKLLDGVDHNGSSRTFDIDQKDSAGATRPTPLGEAFKALEAEVESRRQASRSLGIVHVGLRAPSTREVTALRDVTPASKGGVHSIAGYASEGKVTLGGRQHDLTTTAGRDSFRLAAIDRGVPAARAQALVDLLATAEPKTRDELAQLGLALHEIGTGARHASRLVLSGHGSGFEVLGDNPGETISHETIRKLAHLFPEGSGKITHLAMSSCFCAKESELEIFRDAFPAVKSVWLYNGLSPKAETSAPAHLEDWATKTDGDDPSRVDPRGSNAATWNIVDGRQRFPQLTLAQAEAALTAAEPVWREYQSGRRTLARGDSDPELNRYYFRIQDALSVTGLPDARRQELLRLRDDVLFTRHPELRP
jgi:hypothetical protein